MNNEFMQEAIRLALEGMQQGCGGPFGAVIVKNDKIIGRGYNQVLNTLDPTAHAEIVAIREACQKIGDFSLANCEVYASCEPCPMCLAALYWARVEKIYYGATQTDAQAIGFDDALFYREIIKTPTERQIPMYELMRPEALAAFTQWEQKIDKICY